MSVNNSVFKQTAPPQLFNAEQGQPSAKESSQGEVNETNSIGDTSAKVAYKVFKERSSIFKERSSSNWSDVEKKALIEYVNKAKESSQGEVNKTNSNRSHKY